MQEDQEDAPGIIGDRRATEAFDVAMRRTLNDPLYATHEKETPYLPLLGRETERDLRSGGTFEEVARRLVRLERQFQRPLVPPIRRRLLDYYIGNMLNVHGFAAALEQEEKRTRRGGSGGQSR